MRGFAGRSSLESTQAGSWAGGSRAHSGDFVEALLLPRPKAWRGGASVAWSPSERLFLAL